MVVLGLVTSTAH